MTRLTPQEEANLILSQWQREAAERSRMKAAAQQLGECFQDLKLKVIPARPARGGE